MAYTSALLFIVLTFFYVMSWIVTFAILIAVSVPLSRALSTVTSFLFEMKQYNLTKGKIGILLILPIVVLSVVSFLQ